MAPMIAAKTNKNIIDFSSPVRAIKKQMAPMAKSKTVGM